jgi:hypothetical protein
LPVVLLAIDVTAGLVQLTLNPSTFPSGEFIAGPTQTILHPIDVSLLACEPGCFACGEFA